MCFQKSLVAPSDSWNWAGDKIIPSPIVRASRPVPGTDKRYDIDIREFLTTTNNAVIGQHLGGLIDGLPIGEQALFRSHSPGSFNLRADRVVEFISKLKYKGEANVEKRCPDAWLFPDETLSQGGGDCEDLAILLGAFLMASGISSYCVRVALGSLHIEFVDGTLREHDHCWVMYQNEAGIWEILEPLHVVASPGVKSKALRKPPGVLVTEYIPSFVFNTDHLWSIDSKFRRRHEFREYCQKRNFWRDFDPSFAAGVHSDIFDAAFKDAKLPSGAMSSMKRESLYLDANIFTYDPTDHFDNGYIDEGWAKVNSNLAKFTGDRTDWSSMGAAAHGIADFYAHSSYGHFAALQEDGTILPYKPGVPMTTPNYATPQFDLASGKFSTNPNLWQGSGQQAAATWAGKLISGRYAQLHDPKAGFWEGLTGIPTRLTKMQGFNLRGALPHHNEIAVDDSKRGSEHQLYSDKRSGPADRQSYQNQFNWRKKAAIEHIKQQYNDIVREG